MKRETEICIDGQMVDCRYLVQSGEITYLHLKTDGGWSIHTELLSLPWLYESLEAHHANLLEEENCEA